MPHDHAAGVARQPAGRFRGNAHAVFEDGLAGLIGVGQHRRIDVDHDLVAFAGGSGIESVVESGLCKQRQRVRLLLGHGRGLRRRVSQGGDRRPRLVSADTASRARPRARAAGALPLPAPAGPGARPCRPLPERRAGPGLRGAARSRGPRPRRSTRRQPRTIRSTWAAVPARPTASSRASVSGRGHAGQGADLGVRELTAGEGLGQPWQRRRGRGRRERARGPPPGRAPRASSARRRRSGSRCSSRRGRRTRGSDRGDVRWRPRGAPTARRSRRRAGSSSAARVRENVDVREMDLHGRSPFLLGRLYTPQFGATPAPPRPMIPGREMIFDPSTPGRPPPRLSSPLGRPLGRDGHMSPLVLNEPVKRKSQARPADPSDNPGGTLD